MKTKIHCVILSFALAFSAPKANAQKLIQFFDFNNIYPKSSFANDSIGTAYSYANSIAMDTTHATAPAKADYVIAGLTDTAYIIYTRPAANGILVNDGGLPEVLGSAGSWNYDFSSNKYTYFAKSDSGFSGGNMYLKALNPSAGSAMYIYIPTTGYSNIYFEYCISASSPNAAQFNFLSYSVNGGKIWKNLTRAMDTFNISGVYRPDTLQMLNPITVSLGYPWYPVQINFKSDDSVNNNPNFVVRFEFGGANSAISSHNERYDNFAVWSGNPNTAGIDELSSQEAGYNVYPNPAGNFVNVISTHYSGNKVITVYSMTGETLSVTENHDLQTAINTSYLNTGVYFVKITEVITGSTYTVKFVKE